MSGIYKGQAPKSINNNHLDDSLKKRTVQAWVNFNGFDAITIRDSSNVSSVTDNGTGDYFVNFETPLSNADYAITLGAGGDPGPANLMVVTGSGGAYPPVSTVNGFSIVTKLSTSSGLYDVGFIHAAVLGGQI